jgi:LuxR family transcriptional regulator, maltose regulon positive regulatory protein
MSSRLLETKLYAPRPRDGLIARPRLDERLSRGLGSRLTLISAPAGFGKTTLIAQRLAARAGRLVTAWLSLDAGDSDPVTFMAYLIAALQSAVPGVGADARKLLDAPGARVEDVLVSLLNDLGSVSTDAALVLDDYHVIDAPEIHAGLTFLVEHLPPGMHVVIATRVDPPLPLARLRVRGELLEIRAGDLRFTAAEAAAYLGGTMGLTLTTHDVDTLERRTEGWIAALQLAGLSLQGREDVTRFIDGFAGDDRYVVDYLVEEVLQRQPEEVRSFLLETSILSRLDGPLCDAVTGQGDGRAMLDTLDRRNLFLVPLDDRRQWFRYHHLFADVLRAHLLAERPELVPELHRRAAAWFALHGDRPQAISHAMAGGDSERAAELVELAIPEMNRLRQERTLRGWFEALPAELFTVRPMLALGHAGALLSTGEDAGVDALLDTAERWLDPPSDAPDATCGPRAEPVVMDPAEFVHLRGHITMHRAALARMRGDVAGTITHAQQVLDLTGDADHLRRGGAAALLGLAYWTSGDLDAAQRWYADGMASLQRADHVADVIGGAVTQADLLIAQGRLGDAQRTYERGLRLALGDGGPVLRGAADMHVGLAELARERNDLETARQHLRARRDLGDENGMPQDPHRWRIAEARIRLVDGDHDGALALLDEAERRYVADFAPEVRPISALKARAWIAAGRLPDASAWVRERGLSTDDHLTYLREYEHVTLARIRLAEGAQDRDEGAVPDVLGFLARLLEAAQDGGRMGSVIDILVVQALAHQAVGDLEAALAVLRRALQLAEPEGYARTFLDEGQPMERLLRLAMRQPEAPRHGRRLVASLDGAEGGRRVVQPLFEPLSDRELEVLRLLDSDLDGPDLARELTVSLPTVRTHTRNIYAKLGVNSRRMAVRRAAELGLLSHTRDHRPTA